MCIRDRAKSEDPQPQDRASIHVLDGLVHYALPFTADGGACIRGFCPFCAEAGKLKLVLLLHVLRSEMYYERFELSSRPFFPEIAGAAYGDKFADLAGPMISQGCHRESSNG